MIRSMPGTAFFRAAFWTPVCSLWALSGAHAAVPLRGSSRFLYIDGLRGVAALAVALFHFHHVPALADLPSWVHSACAKGHVGVPIFFVLSGFVISYTLRRATITPRYVARFAARRSLRLDPAYWSVIFLTLLLGWLGWIGNNQSGQSWWVILANLCYVNGLAECPEILQIGWTLCLEIQFYLVFALLLGVAQPLARRIGGPAAHLVVFGPVAVYSAAIALSLAPLPWPGLFVGHWHLFFLGVVTSWIVQGKLTLRPLLVCVLGAAFWLCCRQEPAAVAAAAAAVTALSIAGAARLGRLHDALGWRWLQYLGLVSYSIYLVHQLAGRFFLDAVGAHCTGLTGPVWSAAILLGAVAVTCAAAHGLYLLVERPSLALAKKVRMPAE